VLRLVSVAAKSAEGEPTMGVKRAFSELPPPLGAVVGAYDRRAELKASGAARLWRNVKVPGWPRTVHYEFLWRGHGKIGVELHFGGTLGSIAAGTARACLPETRRRLPDAKWDPTFRPGVGRIEVPFSVETDPDVIAGAMLELIASTRPAIDAELLAAGDP
jgi:hypothetical protein